MEFLNADDLSGLGIQLYECPAHGLYHFGRKIDLAGAATPRNAKGVLAGEQRHESFACRLHA
jgi:hypothetical protein